MGLYSNSILLSDLDGTLLDHNSMLSAENISAVHYFTQNGGRFGISTGRMHDNASGFISGLCLNFYSILGNGSILYNDVKNEICCQRFLEKPAVTKFIECSIEQNPAAGIQVFCGNTCLNIHPRHEKIPEWVMREQAPFKSESLQKALDMPWNKVMFYSESDGLLWLQNNWHKFNDGSTNAILSGEYCFELLPANTDKSTMLSPLRKKVENDAIIFAVGNYYNDEALTKNADVGIMTANAPPKLQKSAREVCADCNSHAISDVIRRIIPKYI